MNTLHFVLNDRRLLGQKLRFFAGELFSVKGSFTRVRVRLCLGSEYFRFERRQSTVSRKSLN